MTTLTGVVPVVPTVFTDAEDLDPQGQRRVARYLIDSRSDALCLLANYSEQFSLTDDERAEVIDQTLDEVAGQIPVMVTTSHFSARVAAQRSADAQRRGANMLMLMPPFFGATMSVDDQGVVDYFKRVAEAVDIDIMIQDAPLSTTRMSVELIARIAEEIPSVKYVKVEVPRTAQKLRSLIDHAGAHLPGLFDGEESITLIPDLHAGAIGTMCSAVIPDRLGDIVRTFVGGSIEEATLDWESLLPLIHYENRQCGLLAAKVLLQHGGIISSAAGRSPLSPLPEWTVRELVLLAQRQDALILRWAS